MRPLIHTPRHIKKYNKREQAMVDLEKQLTEKYGDFELQMPLSILAKIFQIKDTSKDEWDIKMIGSEYNDSVTLCGQRSSKKDLFDFSYLNKRLYQLNEPSTEKFIEVFPEFAPRIPGLIAAQRVEESRKKRLAEAKAAKKQQKDQKLADKINDAAKYL